MKKILVIRTGAIGDTLLLLPFLKRLEQQYPGVEIGLMGKPERMQLLSTQLNTGRVYDLDADFAWLFVSGVSAPAHESVSLQSQDWIIHFTARPGETFEKNLKKLGCPRVSSLPALPPEDYQRHAVFHPFDVLGLPASTETLVAYQTEWHLKDHLVNVPIEKHANSPGGSHPSAVILSPGAGNQEKRWPLVCWEDLLEECLRRRSDSIIVLTGPAEDRDRLERLGRERGPRVAFARDLSLADLPCLLSQAGAFVGNDSGVTHLAALMGIPTLALFGPTNPCRWGPIGARSSVFWGATLYQYPEWIEKTLEPPSSGLGALSPEAVLGWLERELS